MARAQTVIPQQYAPALPKGNVKRLPPAPARPVRKVEVPRTSAWATTLGDRSLPWLLPLTLLGLWYLGVEQGWLSEQVLPPPAYVYETLSDLFASGDLWINAAASLQRVVVGFALGGAIGLALGLAMGLSKTVEDYLLPTFNAIVQIPVLGWLPFALLLLLLCGGRRHWPLRMASRIWAPGLLRGAGARLQIEGFDTVDFSKPCIVVANHQSMIDVCVLFRALPVPLCFVMKDELAKVPVVGTYARAMGMVFIERGAAREATRRMRRASALFAAGLSVCGFPEGTRSRHGEVGQFKGGIFKFAIENGMPILPVAIQGSGTVLPANGFRVRPGRIRIRAGQLIYTAGLGPSDRSALATRSREAVVSLLERAAA